MVDSEFSLPPISGENVPFKELPAEQPKVTPEPVEPIVQPGTAPEKRMKLTIVGLAIALLIVLALLGAVLVSSRSKKTVKPLPSPTPIVAPTPEATSSGLPKNIQDRRDALEKQINNLDLQETDLAFPALDFNVNFK